MNVRRICAALILLSAPPALAHTQTARVVVLKDSALLIVSPPACKPGCVDSVRIEWRYGGQYVSRFVRIARGVDTSRVARIQDTSAYTDSALLVYTPLPNSSTPTRIGLFIAPLKSAAPATTAATAPTQSVAPPMPQAAPKPAPEQQPAAPTPSGGFNTMRSFAQPTPPATFSTAYPKLSGKVRRVEKGDDLQRALNEAQAGDQVVLANGAVFKGNFRLPRKAGNEWIVVRGETLDALPGERVTPKGMLSAAIVVTPNSDAAIIATDGAARWRLVGFEVAHGKGAPENYGIVVLGSGPEKTLADQPSDIILDRMYIHGSETDGTRRCVTFNGARLAVINSWLGECHTKGSDAQGVCGWSGPGPFIIENNHIEASGQGIMFGGADPEIANVSPSDIIIRRNYFFKPLSWGRGKWSVKASFELKHARRVLYEGNIIENHWAESQSGIAVLFQSVSQYSKALGWTVVEDVMMRNNIIRNSAGGVNVLSRGTQGLVKRTARVLVINNWFDNVGRDPFDGVGNTLVQVLSDVEDFTFTKNTITLKSGKANKGVSFDGAPAQLRTTISDNIFPETQYAMTGRGTAEGIATMLINMPGGTFINNVLPGTDVKYYPAGGIVAATSGANMAAINAATSGVMK